MNLEQIVRGNIRTLARAYGKATRRSPAAVSKEIYGNVHFLDRLASKEQTLTLPKATEIIETFRANWPAGAEWPYLPSVIFDPPPRRRG